VAPTGPATPVSASELVGEEVAYRSGDTVLKGYLAYDKGQTAPRPGVLVVHEWWGHNDYARKRADMLAAVGYTALAVDMYGDGKRAAHPEDAMKFMKEVMDNIPEGERRFDAAKAFLEAHPSTDPGKTAAIGYCFGGAVVLHMARKGSNLAVAASFHGNLGTQAPARKGVVKARVMAFTGAADPFVPAEQVAAFEK
jgi:dienelactone hydrolase